MEISVMLLMIVEHLLVNVQNVNQVIVQNVINVKQDMSHQQMEISVMLLINALRTALLVKTAFVLNVKKVSIYLKMKINVFIVQTHVKLARLKINVHLVMQI